MYSVHRNLRDISSFGRDFFGSITHIGSGPKTNFLDKSSVVGKRNVKIKAPIIPKNSTF